MLGYVSGYVGEWGCAFLEMDVRDWNAWWECVREWELMFGNGMFGNGILVDVNAWGLECVFWMYVRV